MNYKYIDWESGEGIVTLWLNRPEKRNAIHHEMILELNHALQKINEMEEDTILLIRGRGEVFCSGADLEWMQQSVEMDSATNYKECLDLAQCFFNIYSCDKVTIAVVHGAAFGGGVGLAAVCDMTFCANNTRFSLSELKMGLVASTISPYVLKRLGETRSKELILTGRQFNGTEAESYGLVNRSVPPETLETITQESVSFIQKGGVHARSLSKKLIQNIAPNRITKEMIEDTARILANVRISKEAQQRMTSYLHKVK